MNNIEFLKSGSGIYIKPSKRGSFTKYCNGKVTNECIAKGKRSSSAAIRKKATFAANARKWKHLDGGIISAQEGTKTSWWQKAYNWANNNSDWLKAGFNAFSGMFNSLNNGNKEIDSFNDATKAGVEALRAKNLSKKYQEALKKQTDPSALVNQSRAYKIAMNSVNDGVNDFLSQRNTEKQTLLNKQNQSLVSSLGGLENLFAFLKPSTNIPTLDNPMLDSSITNPNSTPISIVNASYDIR